MPLHAVTGVFSYTGSFIARELLARGEEVRTLSRRTEPEHALAPEVSFARLQFDDAGQLRAALRGVTTLHITYWIRFGRDGVTFDHVVENTRTLLRAAREAGVERVVYVSATHADERSPFAYFAAKGRAERAVRDAGMDWAIVRPTLIFARDDILVQNIAWALRRFPLFPLPGRGAAPVQPVSGADVARIAVASENGEVVDAAGPDVLTFAELVRLVRGAVGGRTPLVPAPPLVTLGSSSLAGRVLGDVLLTREELGAVRAGLLTSRDAPLGRDRFADWLARDGAELGRGYVSERRRNWSS